MSDVTHCGWTYCHKVNCEACYPITSQRRQTATEPEAVPSTQHTPGTTRDALVRLLDAARRIDDELRRAWDARVLPAVAVSGEAIRQLRDAIHMAESASEI